MTKKVVVLGAGLVGNAIAIDLKKSENFEVTFEFKKVESGINHIVAKTIFHGEEISFDDHGLGKNSAVSKLRAELRRRILKKAA